MMRNKTQKPAPWFEALNEINGDVALDVLKCLALNDRKIARQIEKQIRQMLDDEVDTETIAAEVQADLEILDVEDVWDGAGKDRYGTYTDPSEAADQMFSDTIEPYQEKLRQYLRLGKLEHAEKYCLGILKGIYLFEQESDSEYKGWAPDCSMGYFSNIREEWEKNCKTKSGLKNVRAFVEEQCPGWE